MVLLKAGRTKTGSSAAATHTGTMAGEDKVFSAACRQAGILLVDHMEEGDVLAASLISTPLAPGRRVAIITGGGGFGVLAADVAEQRGLDLVRLSEETIEKMRVHLPPWWAPNNPIDLVGGLGYGGPVELLPILMESGEVDGVICLVLGWIYSTLDLVNVPTDYHETMDEATRQQVKQDEEYCRKLADFVEGWDRPLILSSMVARLAVRRRYEGLLEILDRGIMVSPSLRYAIKVFASMAERYEFLKSQGALP